MSPTPLYLVRGAALLTTQRSTAAAQSVISVFGKSPEILEAVATSAMMSAVTTLVVCQFLSTGKKLTTRQAVLEWFQTHLSTLDAIDNEVIAELAKEKKGN